MTPASLRALLHGLSAVAGAVACGLMAWIAAAVTGRLAGARTAFCVGLATGGLYAALPAMAAAGASAAPTMTTLALAVGAIAFGLADVAQTGQGFRPQTSTTNEDDLPIDPLNEGPEATVIDPSVAQRIEAEARPPSNIRAWIAAALAGAACANHAAFAWLGIALLFYALLAPDLAGRDVRWSWWFERLGGFALAFLLVATLPITAMAGRGLPLPDIMGMALSTPYPILGDRPVDARFMFSLTRVLPPILIAAPFLAIPLLASVPARAPLMLLAFLPIAFGPALPALTNAHGVTTALVDNDASQLLAVGATLLLGVLGLTRLVVAEAPTLLRLARVGAVITVAILALRAWPNATENTDRARTLADEILIDQPPQAIVVTGTPSIWGLLRTTQYVEGVRPDLTIVAGESLSTPAGRYATANAYPHLRGLDTRFPTEASLERWRAELPTHLAVYALQRERMGSEAPHFGAPVALVDFALWDLVTKNLDRGPLAFVGVDAAWLTTRGQLDGWSIAFPALETPTASFGPPMATAPSDQATEAERATLAALLLPLSDCARRQGEPRLAYDMAKRAAALRPFAFAPILAQLRAQVRAGALGEELLYSPEDAAAPTSSQFQALKSQTFEEAIATELVMQQAEAEFWAFIGSPDGGTPQRVERRAIFARLWEVEAFALLENGYQTLLDRYPDDAELHYELAAVHAQRGRWVAAAAHLAAYDRHRDDALPEARARIRVDGRFAQFVQTPAEGMLDFQ